MDKMIYFDHASTTYVYPEVIEIISETMKENWGNPMNLHSYGMTANALVKRARVRIAEAIKADPSEIVFTSCSSESNALAINQRDKCICSPYEHHDIKDNTKTVIVDEDFLDRCLLVTDSLCDYNNYIYAHMLVNNETGEIFDVKEKIEKAHKLGMLVLIDATQALGNIPIDAHELGADFMSFSFHKVHAPKGIGALYVSKQIQEKMKIKPIIFGSQENNMRGGTSNVPYILGSAEAIDKAIKETHLKNAHCQGLRDAIFEKLVLSNMPFIVNEGKSNVPSILNIAFPDITGESLMLALDADGICVSTGSACNSGDLKPSEVLSYMKVSPKYINGAIRISMSLENTYEEAVELADSIVKNYKILTGVVE